MKFNILRKIALTFVVIMIIPITIAGVYLNKLIEDNNNENINERLNYGKNYILNIIKINEVKNKAKSIKIAGDRRLWNYLDYYSDDVISHQDSRQFSKNELYQMMASEDISVLKIYDIQLDELFDVSYKFIDEKFRQIDLSFLKQSISGIITKEILMHQGILIYSSSPVREYYKGTVTTGKITNILVQGKLIKKSAFENLKEMSEQEICLIETGNNGNYINVITTFHDAYGTNLSGHEIVNKDLIKAVNTVISPPEEAIFRTVILNDKRYKAIFFPIKTSASKLYTGAVFQEIDILSKGVEQYYIVILLVIVLSSILLASVLISRGILRPLTSLVHGIDDLSGNIENDEKITKIEVNSRDEFYTLSTAFNNMAERLQHSFYEVELLKDYLKNIFDSVSSVLIAIDAKGVVTHWNAASEKFCSIKAEKAVASSIWDVTDIFSEMRQTIEGVISSGVEDEYDWKYLDDAGQQKYQHVSLFPLISDEILGLVIRVDDTTEYEKKNQQLVQAQKMEAVGLMAGGVAHDLNNILSGVVSYPELLLLQLPEDSKLVEPLKTIQDSGQRAAEIVSDLLTVARGVSVNPEIHNLNILIEEYLNSPEYNKVSSFHTDIITRVDLASDLLNISCSPVHIKKCLMNLITNAFEAIGEKGSILISTHNLYIDTPISENQYMEKGEYAVLSVSDTGLGIPKKNLKHIFEPFYSKKVMGCSGTGLGLAIVWNTVHDHQGSIMVKSDENGTKFELYFPITRDEIIESDQMSQLDDLLGHGETILVIDDVKQQREIACKMLTTLNYKPDSVSSGEKAVTYLLNCSVDLLLLDMIMEPGLNGRQTYEHIIKSHPGQKALIASGFSENEEVEKTIQLGAGAYIKKPYSLNQLGRAVKKTLNS